MEDSAVAQMILVMVAGMPSLPGKLTDMDKFTIRVVAGSMSWWGTDEGRSDSSAAWFSCHCDRNQREHCLVAEKALTCTTAMHLIKPSMSS